MATKTLTKILSTTALNSTSRNLSNFVDARWHHSRKLRSLFKSLRSDGSKILFKRLSRLFFCQTRFSLCLFVAGYLNEPGPDRNEMLVVAIKVFHRTRKSPNDRTGSGRVTEFPAFHFYHCKIREGLLIPTSTVFAP